MNSAILIVDGRLPPSSIEKIVEVVPQRDAPDAVDRWLRKRNAEEQHISYYHAPTHLPISAPAKRRPKLSKKEYTRRKGRSTSR
jgi:hypothetical protein